MNTKLTLTMDKSIIERAKKYARGQDRSLSNLVENYLKSITYEKTEKKETDEEIPPKVKSLMGSVELPESFDYKEEIQKYLAEKYL